MRLDAPTLARAWLSVAQASVTKDDAAVLSKTIAVEEHTRGLRLVATDRFMLLTAWVPSLDAMSDDEPALDEAPERTVVAADLDGRAKSLLGYVLMLAKRAETDDDVPGMMLQIQVTFDVKVPAGEHVPDTLAGLEPVFTVLSVPDTERVYLPVVQAEYPQWRELVDGFTSLKTSRLAFNPEFLHRVAAVRRWCFGPLVWDFGGPEKVAAVDYPESDPHVSGLVMPIRWTLPGEPDPADADTTADGAA